MTSRILPILALMIALATFFVYVSPTWSGPISETKAAIASDEKIFTAAEEFAEKQNQLAAARNAIDPANLDRLEVFLPDSVNNVGLILDLNALAARSGLSLANVDILNTSDPKAAVSAGTPSDGSVPTTRPDPVRSEEQTSE